MNDKDTKRISRLIAILTQLQTKRLITATLLAQKFAVSVRTIYRDIKVLEQAGVPISAEDGKGYLLMEGYRIPPVMFTDSEANALITVQQLITTNSDISLIKAYGDAIGKIKAVLQYAAKDTTDLLAKRIAVSPVIPKFTTSDSLSLIQKALTTYQVLKISYRSEHKNELTDRNVEPFALYYTLQESWALIAYCQLRHDFRMFRLDRMINITQLQEGFIPHKLTLAEYLKDKEDKFLTPDT